MDSQEMHQKARLLGDESDVDVFIEKVKKMVLKEKPQLACIFLCISVSRIRDTFMALYFS